MAVHGSTQDNNTTISAAFAQAEVKQTAAQAKPSVQTPHSGTGFSWSAMHSYSGHSMTRTPNGETLSKTSEALGEVFKGHNVTNYEIKLVPLDMKDYAKLPISLIAVVLRDKKIAKPVVSVHILVLEGSVEPWGSVSKTVNGANIDIQRPTSEAYKSGIGAIVAEEVSRLYPNTQILDADASVVPRDTDLTDKTRVYELAANSLLAVESRLFEAQGRPQINVANAQDDSTLSVRTTFLTSQAQQLDAMGLPLRSDIEVSLISTINNQQQQGQQGQQLLERQRDLGYATGFIDVIWDPVQEQNSYGQMQQLNQFSQVSADGSLPTAKYRSLYVITDSRIQDVSSVTAQVLSLFPALLLQQNNLWQAAFRPRSNSPAINSKNVGALNMEANLPVVNGQPDPSGRGPILDTTAANFTDQDFVQLIQAMFRPGLGIAIDVPECGASTWYNNIFYAVALGSTEAYTELYNATDILTNGLFSKKFNRGEAIASHYSVVHNGWYMDSERHRRDIRDFDLVALLNNPMAEDKIVVDAWINSFQNPSASMEAKLHDRFRIISKAYSEVHLTGFSNRVILTDKYLQAALQAAFEAGLRLRPQNQFQDQSMATRVSANMNAGLFGMGVGTGVFNSSINMNINNNHGIGGFAGRFGNM